MGFVPPSMIEYVQKIDKDRKDIGLGPTPGYLNTEAIKDLEYNPTDSFNIGGNEGYSEYYTPPKGAGKTSGSDKPESTGSIKNDKIEAELKTSLDDAQKEFEKLMDSLAEGDYYYIDENGYWVPRADKLEALFQKLMTLSFIINLYNMALEGRKRKEAITAQMLFGKRVALQSSQEDISQYLQGRTLYINNFAQKLFSTSVQKNQEIYQGRMKNAESYADDWYEQVGDFFSGGECSMDVLKKRIEVSQEFSQSIMKWIKLMHGVLATDNIFGIKVNLDYSKVVKPGYNGYVEIDTEEVMRLRQQILDSVADVNFNWEVLYNELDRLTIPLQILFDVRSGRTQRGVTNTISNIASSHLLSIFDQTMSLYMAKTQIDNQAHYDKYQLQKLEDSQAVNIVSALITVACIVISLIATYFGGPVGAALLAVSIALATVSAALRLAVAAIVDSLIDDEYKPEVTFHQFEDITESSGDEFIDRIIELQRKQNKILAQPNKFMLKPGKDGYKQIDFTPLLQIQSQLQTVQMEQDIIIEHLQKSMEGILITAQMYFNVDLGSGMKQLIIQDKSNRDQHSNLWIEIAQFNLRELKNANNMERQQTIALENATTSFLISIGVAVVGGILGAASGVSGAFAVGWGIGSALGNVLSQYLNASVMPSSSAGLTFEPDRQYLDSLKKQLLDPELSEEDKRALEIHLHILEHGVINAKTQALDPKLLSRSERMLGMIAKREALKESAALLPLEALRLLVADIFDVHIGDSKQMIDRARRKRVRGRSMRTRYITNFLKEKTEVLNRAAKAADDADAAGISLIINAAIAVVGALFAGFNPTSLSSLSIMSITSTLMSIGSSIYNAIRYGTKSTAGYGDLDDHSEASIKDNLNLKKKKYNSRYDQLEDELYLELTNELLSTFGLNSGFGSAFQSKAERINRGQEMIVQSQTALMKALRKLIANIIGSTGQGNDLLNESQEIARQSMLSVINSYMSALQVISQRQQDMDRNKSQLIKAIVQLVISVVSLVAQVAKADAGDKLDALGDEQPANKGLDNKLAANDRAILSDKVKFWQRFSAITSLLTSFSGYIVELAYRDIRGEEDGKGVKQITKELNDGDTSTGAASALDRLEAVSVEADINAGFHQLERSKIMDNSFLSKQFLDDGERAIKNTSNLASNYYRELKTRNPGVYGEREKEAEAKRAREEAKRKGLAVPAGVEQMQKTLNKKLDASLSGSVRQVERDQAGAIKAIKSTNTRNALA